MVQQGDFMIQLVEANSKKPFLKHRHKGEIYVEVEPGAEYFIAISKPGANEFSGMLHLGISVDGKSLGYYFTYNASKEAPEPLIRGLWKCENGMSSHSALKFVALSPGQCWKSCHQDLSSHQSYQGVRGTAQPTELAGTIAVEAARNKKIVRSGKGTVATVATPQGGPNFTRYEQGELLTAITLNYCTTPGLVQMGVIPRYDPGKHEMAVKVKKEGKPKGNPPKSTHTIMKTLLATSTSAASKVEIVDLLSSDDESDSGKVEQNGKAKKTSQPISPKSGQSDAHGSFGDDTVTSVSPPPKVAALLVDLTIADSSDSDDDEC